MSCDVAVNRRIVWPKIKRFYWCPYCNVPLLEPTCPICKSKAIRIPLSDPGDARIALERDYNILRNAYIYEFSTERGIESLVGNSVALLNKAPYYDEMKEVYVDGVQVGRLYYDPFLKTWRFRLSKVGALRVLDVDKDVIEKIAVEKKHYNHMDVIRTDKEIDEHKQVLLINASGNIVGLGYSRGKGRIMVHSWWGEGDPFKGFERKSELIDVIKVNSEYMNIVEAKAKKFVALTAEKISKPLIASFSGGKDSLVALHIALSLGLEPIVLFNNTSIELPETVDTVYRITAQYGLKLIEASAGDMFWRSVYEFGVPGRDYRWCCKICKLTPLARTVKNSWPLGGLNIVGQRAFESLDRARSPSLWRLRWAPQLINISPINEWSQFEVWLYILKHKLYVNPLYYMGYERIGCFMCPASTLAELALVEQTHSNQWSQWLSVLEYWRNRLDLPKEWITYGLWRWNAPARYRTIMAKRLGVEQRVNDWRKSFNEMAKPRIRKVIKNENAVSIYFENKVEYEFIEKQYTIVNPVSFSRCATGIVLHYNGSYIIINDDEIVLKLSKEEDIEKIVDVLKLMYRWELCVGCRSCEVNCPTHAIKVIEKNGKTRPEVQKPSTCIRCKLCLYNCPISEVYVEHIIVPLLFDNTEAWRRKSREHHNEVLKKIKNFIKLQITKNTAPRKTQDKSFEIPSLTDFLSLDQ
uniref:4Fe-4S dicluster domain-containing protein n=1 Tax=Ignisphaera aggregans TaxID=334771 RepID=A0A7J2U301_9CREN